MKRCREGQGDLYLCHLQQPVQVIFELTCLNKAFTIFGTESEAVAAFAN
jgi:anti-sigma B factor antagonist